MYLLAGFTATMIVLFSAFGALNEKHMTSLICAIYMVVAGLSALVTFSNNLSSYPLAQSFVEYKIFAQEFVGKIFFFHHVRVLNNSSFQVMHVLKAPDAAGMHWLSHNECRRCNT